MTRPAQLVPPRQHETLCIIEESLRLGRAPSVPEIRERLGVSSLATVHKHLKALQRRGLIDWQPHIPRSLRIRREAVLA